MVKLILMIGLSSLITVPIKGIYSIIYIVIGFFLLFLTALMFIYLMIRLAMCSSKSNPDLENI